MPDPTITALNAALPQLPTDIARFHTFLNGDEFATYQAVDGRTVPSLAKVITTLSGTTIQGKSAYQLAVDGGFTGTQAQWLASLVGSSGASAYQVAVANGFVGSEAEWLNSLVGPPGPSGGVTDGDKGDITVGSAGASWTIGANKVTLAKFQQIATASFLGRTTAATGNVEILTAAQATALLGTFTRTLKGLVPAPGGTTGTTNFLREDGSWAVPPGTGTGGGIADAPTGDNKTYVRKGGAWVVGDTFVNPDQYAGSTAAAKLQAMFDGMPAAATAHVPNRDYDLAPTERFNISKAANYRFERFARLRGFRNNGETTPTLSVNLRDNPTGNDARGLAIDFGYCPIYVVPNTGQAWDQLQSYAFVVNDNYASASTYAHIGMDFYHLQAVATWKQAIAVLGGLGATSGEPAESFWIRFHSCQATAGYLVKGSDGVSFFECHAMDNSSQPTNNYAYTIDKVSGAFQTRIVGGTVKPRNGVMHVVNGSQVFLENVQCEWQQIAGNAKLVDMVYIQGQNRACDDVVIRDNNFGGYNANATDGTRYNVNFGNCRRAHVYGNFMGATYDVGSTNADFYISDAAKEIMLGRQKWRGGRQRYAWGSFADNVLTDISRMARVKLQSDAAYNNGHRGLWIPIKAATADYAFWESWYPSDNARYMVPVEPGAVLAEGYLSRASGSNTDIGRMAKNALPGPGAASSGLPVVVPTNAGNVPAIWYADGSLVADAATTSTRIYLSQLFAQLTSQPDKAETYTDGSI